MKTVLKSTIFWLFLLPLFLSAQQRNATGLLLEDDNYSKIAKIQPISGEKYDILDLEVSLKTHCPQPGFQGDLGSCVAWTIGYGALTVSRAIQDSLEDKELITQRANSASFIYNQIKVEEDCQAGARFSDGLKLLKKNGDCLALSFPNSSSVCHQDPNTTAKREAHHFKIKDYVRLFDTDENKQIKIDETRRALAMNKPVIAGFKIPNSFWDIQNGTTVWQPQSNEPLTGFHAMLIIGYDHHKEYFELMNSFGPNWGDGGFIKISYEDFGRLVYYGFQIELFEKEEKNIHNFLPFDVSGNENTFGKDVHHLESLATIRLPKATNQGLRFETIKVRFNETEQVYEPANKILSKGTNFQMTFKKLPQQYVYAFGVHADGKATLLYETNKTASATSNIILPSKDSAFQTKGQKAEYFCVLVAQKPFRDMANRLQFFQECSGTFQERLTETFGKKLVTLEQIQYAKNVMYFNAFSKKEAVAVLVFKAI